MADDVLSKVHQWLDDFSGSKGLDTTGYLVKTIAHNNIVSVSRMPSRENAQDLCEFLRARQMIAEVLEPVDTAERNWAVVAVQL